MESNDQRLRAHQSSLLFLPTGCLRVSDQPVRGQPDRLFALQNGSDDFRGVADDIYPGPDQPASIKLGELIVAIGNRYRPGGNSALPIFLAAHRTVIL